MVTNVNFTYYCYRCGAKNDLQVPAPNAPEYHHQELTCSSCGDGTHLLISHCPNCERYVYWIDDMNIPDLVQGFSKYMVHHMQVMIDQAAHQGASISVDTAETFPIVAGCPCGEQFKVEIKIEDL
jgi:hypothetical protein